jgi:hypothetical protein
MQLFKAMRSEAMMRGGIIFSDQWPSQKVNAEAAKDTHDSCLPAHATAQSTQFGVIMSTSLVFNTMEKGTKALQYGHDSAQKVFHQRHCHYTDALQNF